MPSPFIAFVDKRLGTEDWCLEGRGAKPVILSHERYTELEIEWERETYGAPLASLQKAAPNMLAALKSLVDNPRPARGSCGPSQMEERQKRHEAAYASARAIIAKAEGRSNG